MKTCLKILCIALYSCTILFGSEEPRNVIIKVDRKASVHIYAPRIKQIENPFLHYTIFVDNNNLKYEIWKARATKTGFDDIEYLVTLTANPTLEDLDNFKYIVSGYRTNEIILDTNFFRKLSIKQAGDKALSDFRVYDYYYNNIHDESIKTKLNLAIENKKKESEVELNNIEKIFSVYKIICTYIPDRYDYLDNLLAPLPENEQNATKELRRGNELAALNVPDKPLKEQLIGQYNTMVQYWQSWKRPQLKKEHIFGLAGLGLGAYYLYKYHR
ncbi:MAG TPA: hypothetical protein VGW78_02825 [Candidatus Babeliales bacterium]|jgi:hypothetical protein|nr:hypothetical protein [Candidatus Babeliales bacterium]